MIVGKSSDLALTEAMKKKYKLEKKKRGYTISSIKDKWVHVATQLLTRKVMRKCHDDEVPEPVVALAKQCAEGVQFNWAKFLCKEFFSQLQGGPQHSTGGDKDTQTLATI